MDESANSRSVFNADVKLRRCLSDGNVNNLSDIICLYATGDMSCHITAIARRELEKRLPFGFLHTRDNCSVRNSILQLLPFMV